jgi:hypothetical protein
MPLADLSQVLDFDSVGFLDSRTFVAGLKKLVMLSDLQFLRMGLTVVLHSNSSRRSPCPTEILLA